MAFYHRYRPQTLTDLAGQASVKQLLTQSFLSQKLSHAYLFVGPRGSGKTSTARILAKMVNCENQPSANSLPPTAEDSLAVSREPSAVSIPCNTCSTCLSITDGSNLDLIEIDAASNRGIEDIRALRETIKLSPTFSPKKVYIIDEVHMLSNEAFNALLKTLEEPPAHVLFILATTEADKIPQTIHSRSTRLDFTSGTIESITEMLQKIVTTENITIDPAAMSQIAKLADGSFRDATKLLDQLASAADHISVEVVNSTLRVSSFDNLYAMASHLINSDTTKSLSVVSDLSRDSIPLRDFTISLADFMRTLLMIKLSSHLDEFSSEQLSKLQILASTTTSDRLIQILNYLQSCLEKIKTTSMPQLALEICLIEITHIPTSLVETVVSPVAAVTLPEPVVIAPPAPEPLAHKSSSNLSDSVMPQNMTTLQDKWTYVLETIRPHNFSLEAIMRTVKLLNTERDTIILEAPYAFHQRIIESPKNRSLLEALFSDVLGTPSKIQVVIGERLETNNDIVNIDLATDDEILRAAAEIFNSDPIES